MSKTFTYALIVIGVYLLIIFPKKAGKTEEKTEGKKENKADTKSGSGLNENADKNGVARGPAGRQKYQFGWTQ